MYSIKPQLNPHIRKDGTQQITLRVLVKRMKFVFDTGYFVKADKWNGERVYNHPNQNKFNKAVNEKRIKLEGRLIENLDPDTEYTKGELFAILTKENIKTQLVTDFIESLAKELKGKLSYGRLKHYFSMQSKLHEFDSSLRLDQLDTGKLQAFEAYIRRTDICNNTINTNMKIVKAILYKAAEKKLVKKDIFENYKVPGYKQPMPEYLEEAEVEAFKKVVDSVEKISHKTAGYYFLLGCYSGLRISDMQRFNYCDMVRNNSIILRAKKNGQIVSIPIYPKLSEILDKVKDLPFYFSEQAMRQFVKEIASLAGIKKNISPHTGRRSFGIMLIDKGFSEKEAADLLADSVGVARVYAKITDNRRNEIVKQRLF